MPICAASVTARAPSSPESQDNNLSTNDHFTKTKIPTADAGAASHRRLQPIEQVVPCCCRRSPRARARVRAAIKVYGGIGRARRAGVDRSRPRSSAAPPDHREKEIRHRRDRAAPLTRGREGSELSEWGTFPADPSVRSAPPANPGHRSGGAQLRRAPRQGDQQHDIRRHRHYRYSAEAASAPPCGPTTLPHHRRQAAAC